MVFMCNKSFEHGAFVKTLFEGTRSPISSEKWKMIFLALRALLIYPGGQANGRPPRRWTWR